MEKIKINPQVFEWIVKASGYDLEELSKKSKISINTLKEVLKGKDGLTFPQIKRIAKVVKRPTSTFFLPTAPLEPPIPHDFRRVFIEIKKEGLLPETLLAIRKARRYQSIFKNLMVSLGKGIEPKIDKVSLDDNPLKIARKERENSKIPIEEQIKWKHEYEAFNKWREFLESKNILVFQIKMPIEDARGFSLIDKKPYVIVVNSSDSILARIFTLFHEYAHILLDRPGICNPTEEEVDKNRGMDFKIEWWCNSFSAEFLFPQEYVKKYSSLDIRNLDRISRKLKLSKTAILTRFMHSKIISREEYNAIIERWKKKEVREKEEAYISQPKKCLKEKGERFISTVFEATNKGFISYDTALDFLEIKLKHLDKLASLVIK